MKIAARYLVAVTLALGIASAGTTRSTAAGRAPRRSQQAAEPAGQTATRLPDGRWFVAGGEMNGKAVATARIIDPASGRATETALPVPRAWHTATVLPEGTVLIAGGYGFGGQLAGVSEIFDPVTVTFTPLAMAGAAPRSGASATLLTDGRVLVVGGRGADGQPLRAEVWDVEQGTATAIGGARPRSRHTATLLPDGRVQLSGGLDAAGHALQDAEIIDASSGQVTPAPLPPIIDVSTPALAASIPAGAAVDVAVDVRIALRFSKPLAIAALGDAVTLSGPPGAVAITVVPAEVGRLAFVTPNAPLAPETTYVLTIDGATDERGVPLARVTLAFTTRADDRTSNPMDNAEAWRPDATGGWQTHRPDSPWRTLPPLMAPPGVTAIAGQVLRLNGQPLAAVTLEMEGHNARSDHSGRFLLLLPGVAAGHHELEIDGRSANRPHRTYGTFEYGLELAPGRTTVLPFTIWMPLIDTAHQVTIASPTASETVVTTPSISGLELHLPAGTVIKDDEGQVVHTLSITPIPVDRPPFPLPKNSDVPVYFTIQPGGAYVHTPPASTGPYGSGAWLVYPNYRHEYVGKRIQFYHYDPDAIGWYVYGLGTVTPNGAQVMPDATTRIHAFTGAMINSGPSPPNDADSPNCCPTNKGGDPVGLATGLFDLEQTDVYLPDTLPIAMTRTYRSRDPEVRPFGPGTTHPYAMFLYDAGGAYQQADLVLPDGAKIHYVRISPGAGFASAVFQHVETATTSATPTAFYKSRIAWNGHGWDLTLKDGTVYVFGENAPLQAMRDRYGNTISITHANGETGNITRVTSPHGRWIVFTYGEDSNCSTCISRVTDNIGRTVTYGYDGNGNLWKVTDPLGQVTEYTYNPDHNMTSVKNRNGVVYVTNEYTTSADAPTPVGWVKKQTHADAGFYTFAYTFDINGKVTQTDVRDPRGYVRRVTFNADGYVLEDTHALNQPEEQHTSADRPLRDNFVRTATDPNLLQTTMTYDSMGNLTSVTRLSNTPNPTTTSYTYEPRFNQVRTVEDPLHHITTYTYDGLGTLTSVKDALQHETSFEYNSQGQLTSVTDALQHTSTFGYTGGDLTTVTDPRNRVTNGFTDAAGRMLRVSNSLGQTTRYTYDANDRLKTVTDPLNNQASFEYFPDGQLASITDANQHTTRYTYDLLGRLKDSTDPLQRTETFAYDLNGNPRQRTDRENQITTRTYDGLNRLHQITYSDNSTITYTYDTRNRLTKIDDSMNGIIDRGYDDFDRLTSETTMRGTVSYTYDAADRRATLTAGDEPTITYGYDDANRLTSITQGTTTVSLTYDDANRRTTLTLPNGIVTMYGYDEANQLTDMTYKLGQTTLGALAYMYDEAGRRTQVGGTWARTGLPQASGLATYNAGNELTQWDGRTFSYDANGNVRSDGLTSYSWNARNQLYGLSGGTNATFAYDALGRRYSKTTNGETRSFLYDGMNVVQELVGGVPSVNMLTGAGVDETFARTDVNGTATFLIDGLGSTVALADVAGVVRTQYSYDPFGATTASGSSSMNVAQFTGRENDETGLYNYRARYYDPRTGRFLSEDPIRSGMNFYQYTHNSPTNRVDPLGLSDNASPWQVGWEWLTGEGPRTHNFADGDPFTELLRQHQHIQELINDVCKGSLPSQGRFDNDLSGLKGIPKYLRDYSTLFSGGLAGNLAATYLGSYGLSYSVTNGTLNIHVWNYSTISSATHPPVIGYTKWWNDHIGDPLDKAFSSGPMSQTSQFFDFHEYLKGRCGCKI